PDPMTWQTVPYATGPGSISMVATTATDPNGVQYYFENLTHPDPNHDSGWRDSPFWEDTGLDQLTEYTYTVRARDLSINYNETAASVTASAKTQDGTPPEPDPMTWQTPPYAIGTSSISMVATTASDPNGVQYYFANLTDPAHDSGWQNDPNYTDNGLNDRTQYTYTVRARDLSVNYNETEPSDASSATTQDGSAPEPDPMTWQTVPYATGPNSIAMVATTASDPNGVQYYFTETSGNPGGSDSGWQSSPFYEDTGLEDLTQYTYRVKARDLSINYNETAWSVERSAPTQDGTPPSPDPMTWATVPHAAWATWVDMTATAATDPSGVEYYFTETSGNPGGSDSGWQDSRVYTDTGLSAETLYTYTVRARDKSINQNETAPSTAESVTTPPPRPPLASDVIVTMHMGASATITLDAIDDGLPVPPGGLSYIITSLPQDGTLSDPGAGLIDTVGYELVNNGNQVI
ncbi:MAG TPA: hypothetical protein HPP51_01915, partial [Planctomycetes bacterium]|nr:hypothetical protein [Planctomycetota bacterium]